MTAQSEQTAFLRAARVQSAVRCWPSHAGLGAFRGDTARNFQENIWLMGLQRHRRTVHRCPTFGGLAWAPLGPSACSA